jgi:hypothetical protein
VLTAQMAAPRRFSKTTPGGAKTRLWLAVAHSQTASEGGAGAT